ncbi:hypothetical protein [Pelagibacterium halotolerans]|uniref:Uncharacterized protein n=1 Tax=Pelagibacterium halotolerans (strain DSM 22347 / JCM 15775 / CGMCC 1.7692 / B2) TaxID=1082931 RepID=G4RDC4_PELHB|nr:hypothetical protein [Pelagibacterium halotolerans]AEQ50750.1 hypothetical protein KKY_711 [Pelagibacterium halotolerans B2]QJR19330.1 hypothetical protein HKM20_13305 [Pelagibacterium halotolerans]SDZ94816.1 hypothetical protein SAMN05428936_101637 [Pelagibacterium halotolerans]
MSEPFEIIAAPFTLYFAALGTAFPAIDAEPGVDWTMIGTSGDKDYDPEGVLINHSQAINTPRGLGSTGPIKAFRTDEDMIISATVWDVTLENYRLAINSNAITTTAAGVGTAGQKSLGLHRGRRVQQLALLARGMESPYGADMRMQYEVPRCFMSGNPQPQYRKGEPAGLAFEFTALEDLNAVSEDEQFGRLVIQHQAALEE